MNKAGAGGGLGKRKAPLKILFLETDIDQGHLACQIGSRGMALRIIGVDHGSKEKLAKDCGAEHFIDVTKFNDETIVQEVNKLTGGLGASAVIVCTASNKAYAQALEFLRFGGTLVCIGMPEGDSEPIAGAYPAALVFKELSIKGSAVGCQRDALEVLDMASRGIVKTKSRLEKMDQLTSVFEEMSEGKLQGRVVIDLQ